MKLALLGDIHANLPALEAVLADIDGSTDVDSIFHLGDLVGYGPWPNETVALIWERRIPGVAGNYDSTVATDHEHCGCRYENPRQGALSRQGYEWTRSQAWSETKRYLSALPFRLDVRPGGGHASGIQLTLFHGAPTRNTLYLDADRRTTSWPRWPGRRLPGWAAISTRRLRPTSQRPNDPSRTYEARPAAPRMPVPVISPHSLLIL